MIRRFIEWLNERFPVQLVVRREEFDILEKRIVTLNESTGALYERISLLESNIKRLQVESGYIGAMSNRQGGSRLER